MDSFIAIDYETANSNYLSACSLGIAIVEKGKVIETLQTFIKPPEEFSYFDPFNSMIHGISESDIVGAPSFDEVWEVISKFNKKYDVPFACHYSGFDIRVTEALLNYYKVYFSDIRFYDTLTISRKLWPDLINHKLDTLSRRFGIKLQHHDAASDARACALIAIRHLQELEKQTLTDVAAEYGYQLGLLSANGVKTMSDYKNYNGPTRKNVQAKELVSTSIVPDGEVNYGSDLFGKTVVFTGQLLSMTRPQAKDRAIKNGATVLSGVSKKTDVLVVGISDFIDFEKGRKTQKLRDAEELNASGKDVTIIDEEEFLKMTI
jgi:DNA polymerase III subunit epsilon